MDDYYQYIQKVISQYAYLGIYLGLLLENSIMLGIIVPGILILLVAGYSAGMGDLNVIGCILSGVAGTISGDNISYLLGRVGAQKIPPLKKLITKLSSDITGSLNRQKPYLLVFFQFPVYLRVAMPAVLGFTRYPFKRWLIIDIVGSILFNLTFIGIGFVIARTTGLFKNASDISSYIQYVFMAVFAIWLFKLVKGIYKSVKSK